MLRKFGVSNFKGFATEICFDLTSSDEYDFNAQCVRNGIVDSCMVYGHNGCGKSNLCLAVFDIIGHLTDKHRDMVRYQNYLNATSGEGVATFSYEFLLDGVTVEYCYQKSDYKTLVSERLLIDGKEVVAFDRSSGNTRFSTSLKGSENLKPTIGDSALSVIKYIRNNTILEPSRESTAFAAFFAFVENMLFFRSLEDRTYIGQDVDSRNTLTAEIIKRGKVGDFESFLNDAHVKCKLVVVETLNGQDLAFDFGKRRLLFSSVMSTGTSAMTLFFYWYMLILDGKVSMVIIDEFDAFYHHELARFVIRKLIEAGVQFVVTTHNTSLMSNDLLRPDCYYLMGNNKILPLSRCTEKELREVHNIEKIYKAGGFYVR